MSRKSYQPEVLIDTYSLGFRFPWPGQQGPLLRNGSIVAVCWDGDDAQFVNAAGLVVPCKAGDVLRSQLTRASHREFGKIVGDGQFAMKPHVLKATENAGTLRKWVLYHFSLCDCLFYDDSAAWDAYEQRELAELDRHYQQRIASLEEYRQSQGKFASRGPNDIELLEQERRQALTADQDRLANQRRQALEQDQQLGAWLSGELPTPPLLRSIA